jgi:hypothetical protein
MALLGVAERVAETEGCTLELLAELHVVPRVAVVVLIALLVSG